MHFILSVMWETCAFRHRWRHGYEYSWARLNCVPRILFCQLPNCRAADGQRPARFLCSMDRVLHFPRQTTLLRGTVTWTTDSGLVS